MLELYKAIARVQQAIPEMQKDGENPYFNSKYLTLPTLQKTLNPILHANGLYVTQFPSTTVTGEPALKTIVFHLESGEYLEVDAALSLTKVDPQAQGSAITYMRRYSLGAIFQIIVDEDDDANVASTITINPPKTGTTTGTSVSPTINVSGPSKTVGSHGASASDEQIWEIKHLQNEVFPWVGGKPSSDPRSKEFYTFLNNNGFDLGKYNKTTKKLDGAVVPASSVAEIKAKLLEYKAEIDKEQEPF